jgi:hypothetical protein
MEDLLFSMNLDRAARAGENRTRRDRVVTQLFGADCESPSFSENPRPHGHAILAAEQRALALLVQCNRTSHSTRRIYAATLVSRSVRVGPPAAPTRVSASSPKNVARRLKVPGPV